jgi:hypothetical protein
MHQQPHSAVHLLLADGVIRIRKASFFMDPDLELCEWSSPDIHLICLMIEVSMGTEIENGVANSLMEVTEILPVINELISAKIVMSLLLPIRELYISVLSERIKDFVLCWESIQECDSDVLQGVRDTKSNRL